MGLFDFLRGKPEFGQGEETQGLFGTNDAGNPAMAPQMEAPGMLKQAPTMQEGPGLLERWRKPDDTGVSTFDRIYAGLGTLRGDGGQGMEYLTQQRAAGTKQREKAQALADRARKNAAFKNAYKDGRFDPGAYTAALGDTDVDPSDIAQLTKAFAPEVGVDGGTPYSIGPDGQVKWGEQRGMSHAEQLAIERAEETERRNREMEDIARGRLGVAQAGEHRRASGGGGGASWLPAGARVVHLGGQ